MNGLGTLELYIGTTNYYMADQSTGESLRTFAGGHCCGETSEVGLDFFQIFITLGQYLYKVTLVPPSELLSYHENVAE